MVQITGAKQLFNQLEAQLNAKVLGQSKLVRKIVIALLADGHLLVEGAPGLAKTRAIKELAQQIHGSFHRVQFTPDLLPGDLTGTDIYRAETATFEFQQGPLFYNVVLADEINRAPAKVQSALLEAMEERQITVGQASYQLPDLFLVMATQNPIEQEGTYPLPEAQLDRFLLHVQVTYPAQTVEREILKLARTEAMAINTTSEPPLLTKENILQSRREVSAIHLSSALEDYLVQLIIATRTPELYDQKIASFIQYGASPRATIALDKCARAQAWLSGRDYVAPEDIHSVVHDVLRHRILLTFTAEAEGVTVDQVVDGLLQVVAIP